MKIHLKFPAQGWSAWGGKIENLKTLRIYSILSMGQKFLNIIKLRNKKKWFGVNGFTLIEMVVVMGMIGIVTLSTLKLVRFSDINKNLSLTTAEVKGVIRTAQTLALAPPIITDGGKVLHVCGFVVINDNSNYGKLQIKTVLPRGDNPVVCRQLTGINQICDSDTTTTCRDYEEKNFDQFSVKEVESPVKIFFRAPYGKVIGSGSITTITVKQEGGSGNSKSIEINKQGKINVQ